MATYTSGSINFSGLSGVDVDFTDLVDKLYEIESIQANQLLEWYSDWEIRLDAFAQVRESLVTMQSALSAINTTDKFLVKSATSSNDSIVAATADSGAVAGSYSVEVNQLALSSVWSIGTGLSGKDALVNDSGSNGTFSYTYKGETRTINVPSGTSLEALKNLINNDGENLGVRVQLIQSGGEIVFQMSGLDTGADASLEINSTTNLNGMDLGLEGLWDYGGTTNTLSSLVQYSSLTGAINTTETPKTFSFEVNGETYSVKLAAGGSLNDLISAINEKTADTGVTAQYIQRTYGSGEITYALHLSTANSADLVTVGGGTLEGYSSMLNAANWQVQQGQNAEIRVNGWPATGWLEVDSNTVTDVADGLTFNLRSKGTATIAVELDTDAIETNVQTFVDAVNQFRQLILDLTKFTENSGIDPEYAENQSEMQSGSALTGNYGVQLMSSNLKQAVASSAKGFSYLQEFEGKMYGDMFTSLAQVGIITDTDQSSDTFGLLIINKETVKDGVTYLNSTGTMTLKEALAKDATAVAKLFAASDEASSNSANFGVNSSVKGITGAGNYDVSYTTDASGNITSATINGKEAKIDGNQISVVRGVPSYTNSGVVTVSGDGTTDYTLDIDVQKVATKATTTLLTEFADKTDSVNTDSGPVDFSYDYNGVTRSFELEPGTTLEDLVSGINKDTGNPGVIAKIVPDGGNPEKYNLVLTARDTGDKGPITVTQPSSGGAFAGAAKTEVAGQDAEYTVTVNGQTSTHTSSTNTVTAAPGVLMTITGTGTTTATIQKDNDADGIVLDVYNLSPGETMTGTVSVRRGKINELLGMLEGTSGYLGSEGTLAILENNYKDIMANIKDKIQKEDERLQKWLRLTKLRFARLETTLSEYQNLQTSIESQIEQLKSNNG